MSNESEECTSDPTTLSNQPLSSPAHCDSSADDNGSVSSNNSSKSEERRRRRELWRREHEKQLKVDGHFPRRNSGGEGEADRKEVSARIVKSHLGTKSTASPHTLPTKVSDSVRVRSNLLRTLGIQKGPPSKDDGAAGLRGSMTKRRLQSGDVLLPGGADSTPSTAAKIRSLLSNVRLTEELKYDSDEDADPYPYGSQDSYSRFFGTKQSRSFDSKAEKNKNTEMTRRRKLAFSEDVQVVPIPMRSEYSNRIKERMYNGRVELSENAQRNVVEFEAEGWDASTVLDDESQFYKCPLTGELIHPVHLAYFKGDSKEP